MLQESITPPFTTAISCKPEVNYIYGRGKIDFKGACFKQDNVSFLYRNTANLYISYKLNI